MKDDPKSNNIMVGTEESHFDSKRKIDFSPQNHQELDDLYCINCQTSERLFPNNEPMPIENDLFSGVIMFMVRTSQCDHGNMRFNDGNNKCINHFVDKKRRFEIQLQVKMKKVLTPSQQLYMGCELRDNLKLGMVQRAFVQAILKSIKRRSYGFHYSLTNKEKNKEAKEAGKYEHPHMVFTFESCMDRISITKPGEEIPQLGGQIHEDLESIERRSKGCKINYNTEDIYTICFWSSYFDFLEWKCLNLTPIKPFPIHNVIGDQNVFLSWYALDSGDGHHYRCNITTFLELEFGHRKKTKVGCAAKKWIQNSKIIQSKHDEQSHPTVKPKLSLCNSLYDSSNGLMIKVKGEAIEAYANENFLKDRNETEQTYLESGHPVFLRDSCSKNEFDLLTDVGGFAVLQNQTTSTIIIEKVNPRLKQKQKVCGSTSRKLSKRIRNGDRVRLKLIGGTGESIRYLAIRRGWWLKWVRHKPKKSGFFNIFMSEQSTSLVQMKDEDEATPTERRSYLSKRCSFYLGVYRRSMYQVGVTKTCSATFGGRVIGLKKIGSANETFNNKGEDKLSNFPFEVKERNQLMTSLHFSTCVPNVEKLLHANPNLKEEENISKGKLPYNDEEGFYLDVPAWIEMMHRAGRYQQRVYVVRMRNNETSISQQECEKEKTLNYSFRLRTGNNVAASLRLRLKSQKLSHDSKILNGSKEWKFDDIISEEADSLQIKISDSISLDLSTSESNNLVALKEKVSTSVDESSTENDLQFIRSSSEEYAGLNVSKSQISQFENYSSDDTGSFSGKSIEVSENEEEFDCKKTSNKRSVGSSIRKLPSSRRITKFAKDMKSKLWTEMNFSASEEDFDKYSSDDTYTSSSNSIQLSENEESVQKKTWTIGSAGKLIRKSSAYSVKKIAKGMKSKLTLKTTEKVGVISKSMRVRLKAPTKEPRLGSRRPRRRKKSRKKSKNDHHVAINKTLKAMRKTEKGNCPFLQPANNITAGQLRAPDQSCRMISHILSVFTTNEKREENDTANILPPQLAPISEFDTWFLRGGSIELGVIPTINDDYGALLGECVVAMCLWESHWREEACLMYESCVVLHAPLSKIPSYVLPYIDIQQIRPVYISEYINPLPGLPLIAIETAWRCHYLAFVDEISRATFQQKIDAAIYTHKKGANKMQQDVWKAHLWQGFQPSSEPSLSEGKGMWAKVASSRKSKQRVVLNTRRMAFDNETFSLNGSQSAERLIGIFVEDLLRQALDNLEERPTDFVEFLNNASRLRMLPLQVLDLSGKESFCIFVNLYHCLLQHALLLSSHGPPTKKSNEDFFRTNCYNVGGDIFSLAELENCVIRGNMSKAINPKFPFVQAPKKSRVRYLTYALGIIDPRVNFVLAQNISSIPILTPDKLDEQLSMLSTTFLREEISVDLTKKIVTLPKVCEVFRNDFGDGDCLSCINYCFHHLDEDAQFKVLECLKLGCPTIRYNQHCDRFH